jgi:hypothetical protein
MFNGEPIPEEIIFAVRMMMVKYGLTPADIMRIMVALEKQ